MKKLTKKSVESILVIGVQGTLAQATVRNLYKEFPQARIVGIDSRPVQSPYISMNYTRTNFETLFRQERFDAVYLIGRISHNVSDLQNKFSADIDEGLIKTRFILELCLYYSVKKVVILSTYHVYGAHPDNPVFVKEEFPLRASLRYPPLLHVVEMDQIACNWMWQYQSKVETVILRPCNIIGPKTRNLISQYLTWKYAPYPIDYNPMFQFIHEYDMANVLSFSLRHLSTGIYNVAPETFISIREALELIGTKGVPTPMFLIGNIATLMRKLGQNLPDYLVDYLKYSCLIDGQKLREQLPQKEFQFSIQESLQQMHFHQTPR